MEIKYWMKAKITKWFYEWYEWVVLEERTFNSYNKETGEEKEIYKYGIQIDLWEWKTVWPYFFVEYFIII